MNREQLIQGFSGLSREEKIRIAAAFSNQPEEFAKALNAHWHPEREEHERYSGISENAVSTFYLPYSLAPNFLINGQTYIVPMVTEESSVVAAASAGAKFWMVHGGFTTVVKEMLKPGHIHFIWKGDVPVLESFIADILPGMFMATHCVEKSMKTRGGGVSSIVLKNHGGEISGYFQLEVLFNTVDAMGANFINTCLETMTAYLLQQAEVKGLSDRLDIIMAILSNYTPQCTVECRVTCNIHDLEQTRYGMSGEMFARRFQTAVLMAHHDVNRAVTHNKGIFNGVDAVIIATGNDFRAVEAAGHAWASRDGSYRGLTTAEIQDDNFICSLEMPMAVGVVGGLTNLHPLAVASLQLLGNPGADVLMSVAASTGMANHFSAIKALITGGIQQGHMKMHLWNLLNRLGASKRESELAMQHFLNRTITHSGVREFLTRQRTEHKHI